MADWTASNVPPPPPGNPDPPPSAASDGWSTWIRDEIAGVGLEEYLFNTYGVARGQPFTIALTVVNTGTVFRATGGSTPGPWEAEPVTVKMKQPPHRDFTRFRRKYPTLTVTLYATWKVTLVVTFPTATPSPHYECPFVFWTPLMTIPVGGWFVYRWWPTSGERVVRGVEVEWYDGTAPRGWDGSPTVDDGDAFWEEPPQVPPAGWLSAQPPATPREVRTGWVPATRESLALASMTRSVPWKELVAPAKPRRGKPRRRRR